jgi:type IV pilus assembly protein PilC
LPIFTYTARNEEGSLVTDTIAFHDELALRHHLRKNSLFVLEIAERRRSRGLRLRRGVSLGDLIIMNRQLRTMVLAGMPLVTGLEALADQAGNPVLAEVLGQIARGVGTGRSLSESLTDYPRIFPDLLITLVKAGEESGRLPEALNEASRQLELQMEVRQKLISALVYPVFTLIITLLVVSAMMFWIVPIFAQIYKDLHATLPSITQLLISISELLTHTWWMGLLFLIVVIVLLKRYYQTQEGRYRLDGIKLKLPIFGHLVRKSASASLTGSLAGLLESGVPLLQALNTSSHACGNEVLATAVRAAARNVTQGRRLSDELERSEQFPSMVVRMIAMAESVGTLPEVLRQIATSYIEEVEYTVRRMMTIIEPIMILCVAGIVGFVIVALYYPIFNLGNAFSAGA